MHLPLSYFCYFNYTIIPANDLQQLQYPHNKQKGSLFELANGGGKLGFAITAAIAALGLPLSIFLIYAAILKGAAETEEADRQYNNPRGSRKLNDDIW